MPVTRFRAGEKSHLSSKGAKGLLSFAGERKVTDSAGGAYCTPQTP